MKRSRVGFTLIELLVVVAIISILASVIYASFGQAREQARNTSLQSELKEVQLALEVYRAQEGQYPGILATLNNACKDTSGALHYGESQGSCGNSFVIGGFIPEYISEMPVGNDSRNPNCTIRYDVDAGNSFSRYKLSAIQCFEGADSAAVGIQPNSEFARCPDTCSTCGGATYNATTPDFYETMAVYSPGGECL